MIVYRVENLSNEGPYRNGAASWGGESYSDDDHPMPGADGIPMEVFRPFERAFVFGFETLSQVNDWFSPQDRKKLDDHGFFLSTYEVDKEHVHLGRKQLIFNRKHVKKLNQTPLTIGHVDNKYATEWQGKPVTL